MKAIKYFYIKLITKLITECIFLLGIVMRLKRKYCTKPPYNKSRSYNKVNFAFDLHTYNT